MRARSGVITVTTAGEAVRGPDSGPGEFFIKADPENTGYIYVGNDGAGAVSEDSGFKLAASDAPTGVATDNLNNIWFDASVSGEKASWLRIGERPGIDV